MGRQAERWAQSAEVCARFIDLRRAGSNRMGRYTQFLEELRVAIFLSGGRRAADLRSAPRVVLGETRRWIEDIGCEAGLAPAPRPAGGM